MNTSQCKKCGKKILWATNKETGKKIPLDPRPPVYAVRICEDGSVEAINLKKEGAVSHFATCPDADYFSGGKK